MFMDNTKFDLARYRLEKAINCIEVAKLNLDNNYLADSANRSYYAIFHAARAVLALDGVDRKRHSGVISYFLENYIKTKIFDIELSRIIQDAFDIRQDSDYEDFYIISRDDAAEQLQNAEKFCDVIKNYINSKSRGED